MRQICSVIIALVTLIATGASRADPGVVLRGVVEIDGRHLLCVERADSAGSMVVWEGERLASGHQFGRFDPVKRQVEVNYQNEAFVLGFPQGPASLGRHEPLSFPELARKAQSGELSPATEIAVEQMIEKHAQPQRRGPVAISDERTAAIAQRRLERANRSSPRSEARVNSLTERYGEGEASGGPGRAQSTAGPANDAADDDSKSAIAVVRRNSVQIDEKIDVAEFFENL